MKIDVLTLFPKFFSGPLNESIIKRAVDRKIVEINIINIRNFTGNKHKQADDYPYGGGVGMILMCEPIFNAVKSIKDDSKFVISTSPRGKRFNSKIAKKLSKKQHLVFICGHYEGMDERIYKLVNEEISIGDYILTGGEVAVLVIIDAVFRYIPGVLGNKDSITDESFERKLLEYPQYTRPAKFLDMNVPDVLLSGNHKKIKEWRERERERITRMYRPDLLKVRREKCLTKYRKTGK